MSYYVGNGVYEYLSRCPKRDSFYWTSGNLWLLVYGNTYDEPKVLTIASEEKLEAAETEAEKKAAQMVVKIAGNTGIPVNFVRFDPAAPIERVRYCERGMKSTSVISSEELKNRFARYGLIMNQLPAQKSINDKSSSPYHVWQRLNMGSSVVVSDIDLLRLENHEPEEIIELKRSFIPLDRWRPYEKDYNNFRLLSALAQKRGLGFYIVYNYRKKTPFFDDVSYLKIFQFDHRRETECSLPGYREIDKFAEHKLTKW